MGIKQFSNPASGYVNKFLRSLNFDSTGGSGAAYVAPPPPDSSGITATGGQVSEYTAPTGEVYKTHQFVTSGSFVISAVDATVPAPLKGKVDWLVIGGGGAGGCECSGGGGAASASRGSLAELECAVR